MGGEVPSDEDCALLMKMKSAPVKASHPCFFHYYNALAMFKPEVMKAWKKVEKVEADAEDDVDLFGSDEDDEEVEREREARIAKAVAE